MSCRMRPMLRRVTAFVVLWFLEWQEAEMGLWSAAPTDREKETKRSVTCPTPAASPDGLTHTPLGLLDGVWERAHL